MPTRMDRTRKSPKTSIQSRTSKATSLETIWSRDVAGAAVAGLGVLIPGAALSIGTQEALRVALAAVIAAVCVPFLSAFAEVQPDRRHLMPEERIGLVIFLMSGVTGAASLWLPAGWALAGFGILLFSPLGAGASACAGLAAGSALLLAGGDGIQLSALGLCGLLTGMAQSRLRWPRVVTPIGVLLTMVPLLGIPLEIVLSVALSACVWLFIPERCLQRMRMWLADERQGACDPDRLALRLRAETSRRLRALSDAFGELADGYRIPVDIPDEQMLISDMRDHLCENCPDYTECWVSGDNKAVRFLCQMISEAIDWSYGNTSEPLFGEEMPPDVLRQCCRGEAIPERLGALLQEFAQKRRSEMKRGAMNQLISAQFMQAQLLLGGLADQQERPVRVRGRQAARARAALDRAGIAATEVMALRGARMEIVARLRRGIWTQDMATRAAEQLSRVFGRTYAPGVLAGAEIKFVRLPRLRAIASSASHSSQDGVPNGDSHVIRMLEGDRLLMMLSDGMGNGEAAARESAQTLRLLDSFLAADVSRPLALETVNELMLARSDSDMFATVDLCMVDLSTGEAEFTKLAACRSLIARNGRSMCVEGGKLPLGILEKVQPSVQRIQLNPGDVVLMASDGIMDAIDIETLQSSFLAAAHRPPEEIAERILSLAKRTVPESRRDDMTVLCTRLVNRAGGLRLGDAVP